MPNSVENLKKQFEQSANEFEKWNASETLSYLKTHSSTQYKTTEKIWDHFLNLAKQRKCPQKILSDLLKDSGTRQSIIKNKSLAQKFFENEETQKVLCQNDAFVNSILLKHRDFVHSNRKFRKSLLSKSRLPEHVLAPVCPKEAKDPVELPIANTGVYLWKLGYDVIAFLGSGSFGVVWECVGKDGKTHKAIKVLRRDESGIEEIEHAKKLYEMFKDDEKAQKYFNLLKPKKNINAPILKALLAQQDLYGSIANKLFQSKKGKTLDSVLRNAEQTLKAVIELHKAGYSHNDIKPENFLKINNWKSKKNKLHAKAILQDKKAELDDIRNISSTDEKLKKLYEFLETNKIQNSKIENVKNSTIDEGNKAQQILEVLNKIIENKVHKNRVQLADFGTITPIPKEGQGEYCRVYTPGYVAKSDIKYILLGTAPKEVIEKRDVYALGVTFLDLLVGRRYNSIECLDAIHQSINDEGLVDTLFFMYSGETDERLKEFALIIRDMTYENHNQRITLSTALNRVRALRSKK